MSSTAGAARKKKNSTDEKYKSLFVIELFLALVARTKVFLSAWRMANGVLVNETKDTTIRLLSKGRGLLLSTFAAILY